MIQTNSSFPYQGIKFDWRQNLRDNGASLQVGQAVYGDGKIISNATSVKNLIGVVFCKTKDIVVIDFGVQQKLPWREAKKFAADFRNRYILPGEACLLRAPSLRRGVCQSDWQALNKQLTRLNLDAWTVPEDGDEPAFYWSSTVFDEEDAHQKKESDVLCVSSCNTEVTKRGDYFDSDVRSLEYARPMLVLRLH